MPFKKRPEKNVSNDPFFRAGEKGSVVLRTCEGGSVRSDPERGCDEWTTVLDPGVFPLCVLSVRVGFPGVCRRCVLCAWAFRSVAVHDQPWVCLRAEQGAAPKKKKTENFHFMPGSGLRGATILVPS